MMMMMIIMISGLVQYYLLYWSMVVILDRTDGLQQNFLTKTSVLQWENIQCWSKPYWENQSHHKKTFILKEFVMSLDFNTLQLPSTCQIWRNYFWLPW